jgi:hypothetical protein
VSGDTGGRVVPSPNPGRLLTTQELERRIAALPHPKVDVEFIRSQVASVAYHRHKTLTVAFVELHNGFIVTGESACADERNYRQDIGQQLAYQDAERKLWPLFGFDLRRQLHARAVDQFNEEIAGLESQP